MTLQERFTLNWRRTLSPQVLLFLLRDVLKHIENQKSNTKELIQPLHDIVTYKISDLPDKWGDSLQESRGYSKDISRDLDIIHHYYVLGRNIAVPFTHQIDKMLDRLK